MGLEPGAPEQAPQEQRAGEGAGHDHPQTQHELGDPDVQLQPQQAQRHTQRIAHAQTTDQQARPRPPQTGTGVFGQRILRAVPPWAGTM